MKAEALVHGRGRIDLAELTGELQAKTASGQMLAASALVGINLATEASLEREQRMFASIDQARGEYASLAAMQPSFHVNACGQNREGTELVGISGQLSTAIKPVGAVAATIAGEVEKLTAVAAELSRHNAQLRAEQPANSWLVQGV